MHGHTNRETQSKTVLDSGCTKTVGSKTWLNCYLESLSSEELYNTKRERSGTEFKFVNRKVCCSIERITIPVVIVVQNVFLTTEAIENDISVLLSKDTMKKTITYIDFINDKVILNKETLVKFITPDHYYISMGKTGFDLTLEFFNFHG